MATLPAEQRGAMEGPVLDRQTSPDSVMRRAWKLAAAGARTGDANAKRRANFAWRQLHNDSHRQGGARRKRQQYIMNLPEFSLGAGGNTDMESLVPVRPEEEKLPCLLQRAMAWQHQRKTSKDPSAASEDQAVADGKPFLAVAMTSICVGAAVVAPYISFLKRDPGGVLFFSFVVHVTIVAMHLPAAGALWKKRRIPLRHHLAMAVFWCLFTTLKSDAFVRLPTSLCVLLSNMRMMVGMLVQVTLFGKRFSRSQVLGAVIATLGIVMAGSSMQAASATGQSEESRVSVGFLVGVGEMIGSSLCLTLYSSAIKAAFSTYGESIEEQVFVTHLCALLVVFPSQWHKVGPRLAGLMAGSLDGGLAANMVAGVIFNVAARRASARLAGRAPNVLMAQLVQTVDGFIQLLLASLLRAPPFPPGGFWGGSLVLMLGTLQYLRASGSPPVDDKYVQSDEEAPLVAVDLLGTPLRSAWAVATVAAKQEEGGESIEATRRENRAWRKMRMEERARNMQESDKHLALLYPSSKESATPPRGPTKEAAVP